MSVNVVFWIGVKSNDPLLRQKHGNFEYLEYSKRTWIYWCKKNNITFFEYHTPELADTGYHKVTWQRWFDVFFQLDAANINYDKVLMTDGSIMIKWDAPNIFDLTVNSQLYAFKSLENVRWISARC